MSIEAAWYSLLTNKASIASLVGTRVYPEIAPLGTITPYITYTIIGEPHFHHMLGATGIAVASIQTDCWGSNTKEAAELGDALRDAFDGFRGTSASIAIRKCFLVNRSSSFEFVSDGKEQGEHRKILDFSVGFLESLPNL